MLIWTAFKIICDFIPAKDSPGVEQIAQSCSTGKITRVFQRRYMYFYDLLVMSAIY